MTKEHFNQAVFNILVEYATYLEFGDFDILKKETLTILEQERIKNIIHKIEKFNQLQHEKSIQFGQDDQTKQESI